MRLRFFLSVLVALAAIGAHAPASFAGCTDPSDLAAFRKALGAELSCGLRGIRVGAPIQCPHLPVPACAASSFSEAVDLLLGSGFPTGVPSPREWSCEKLLVSKAKSFLKRRSKELLDGRRWTRGGAMLQKVADRCGGLTASGLPHVGGACAPLVAPGQAIDGARLMGCVRGSLEKISQDVTATPLRPNILLILTDDQRFDTMDVMPRVQKLITARGIEFTNGFVNTSLCCPDRASILTGQYAHNHGVQTNLGALVFNDTDTIAIHLRNAGYHTALMGKYMVNTGAALQNSIPPGWSEWRVFKNDLDLYFNYILNENGTPHTYGAAPADYSTDVLAGFAQQFIRAERDGPFFLMFTPFAPHTVATPAPRHEGTFQGIAPWRPPSWLEPDTFDKPEWLRNVRFFVGVDPNAVANTDQRRIDQLETLLAVDEAVEQLSVTLESVGLTDNTLVIFTSDNGLMWLEHWLRLKNYPYEESIHVPFVARYPMVVPMARRMDDFVVHIDFAPTFAELADTTGPASMNGRSFVPLLHGDSSGWRDDILIEHFSGGGIDPHAGVRTKRWKYIETEDAELSRELYDLENDPYEMRSVVSDPANADLIATLAARLAVLRAE